MVQFKDTALCECGCGAAVRPGRRFSRGHNVRSDHPTRGKGRNRLLDGYVFLPIQPDHPYFEMAMMIGGSWYIAEHRLVMAEHLGRPLVGGNGDGEVVHHKLKCEGGSGDKTDNRFENLELFPDAASHRQHHGWLTRTYATHCANGHALTPENKHVTATKVRCRLCGRDAMRARRRVT